MANYGEDVVSAVIEQLGIEVDYKGEGWAMALCPLHEDRKPSFTIHQQEGGWKCFSGCGSSPDLAYLIQRIEGGDINAIRAKLKNMFVDDPNIIRRALLPRAPEEKEDYREPLFYERGRMYPYLLRRGITLDTVKEWNCGIDSQLKAVVVPITDNGKMVGLFRRSIKEKRFFNSIGLDKDTILFGLDKIPAEVDTVIVVESVLDVLWLYQNGYWAVSTIGGGLSYGQAQKLIRRFRNIILSFDNDSGGYSFTVNGFSLLLGKVANVDSVTFPKGKKDNLDCTPEELALIYKGWYT